jgi:hypothetical protein
MSSSVNYFYHCAETPEKISLKEERFIWAYGFINFRPWPAGSIVSGPAVRQNIMMEGCSGAKLFTSWWSRNRERVRKALGQDLPSSRACSQ